MPASRAHSASLGSAAPGGSVVKVRVPADVGGGVGGCGVRTTVGVGAAVGALVGAAVGASVRGGSVGASVGVAVDGGVAVLGVNVTAAVGVADAIGAGEASPIGDEGSARTPAEHAMASATTKTLAAPSGSFIIGITLVGAMWRVQT